MRGTVKKLSITRLDVCNVCHGTGVEPGDEKVCPTCGGSGHVTQVSGKMRFEVTCARCGGSGAFAYPRAEIAAARVASLASNRSTCAFRRARRPARACASQAAATPDCTAALRAISTSSSKFQPHPFFERRGDDLYTVVPVTGAGSFARREGGSPHD